MSRFLALPETDRAQLLRRLRERAEDWLASFFRHEVMVARAVRGMQMDAERSFDREVVVPLLREVGGRLATIRPVTGDLAFDAIPELLQIRSEIERMVANGTTVVRAGVEKHLEALAENEVRWIGESAGHPATAPLVPAAKIVSDLRSRVFLGENVEKWFERDLQQPTADNVRAWVTTGVRRGLSVDEIVSGLKGTRTEAGILADKPRYAVRALTRTAATHAITTSRQESYRALGVTHWRFVATLDLRTSIICATQDGSIHPIGEGPIPPLHPNCRSATAPVLDPSEPRSGTRASMHGPVPASTTFEKWIEQLPVADQDHILGRTKAEAWRAGRLTLKDMLGKDLEPLTLEELKLER